MIDDQGVAMYYDDFAACRETGESRDIQELIQQRDKLLSDNPDLVKTQEEIDRMLSLILSSGSRYSSCSSPTR